MKVLETLNSKISVHVSGSLSSEWGLILVLFCCVILPTEVLITIGVTWALAQLLGQISKTERRRPSKLVPKLLPGVSPPEPYHHSSSQRPVRLRVPPNRAQTVPRVIRPTPHTKTKPEPVRIVPVDTTDCEGRMLAALEAYEAVSRANSVDMRKKALLPAPCPATSLNCLGSNLLGLASFPDAVANRVEKVLLASLPQIRIFSFPKTRGTAGQTLPALEVVIVMRSDVVSAACLQERLKHGARPSKRGSAEQVTGEKLQKSVLRFCLNLLVNQGFKFRRSAMQAPSPTVLLLAPATDGTTDVGIELSVNNPLPFLNASLVCEASLVDQRAFSFITSVQRWADVRGLAHVSFGPLNMYAWAHLAIFYLQMREPHRMPPLSDRSLPPRLESDPTSKKPPPLDASFFEGFFQFLTADFLCESVSVYLRGSPPPCKDVVICDAFRPDVDLGLQLRTDKNAITRIRADAACALKYFSTSGTVADLLAAPDFRVLDPGVVNRFWSAGWAWVGRGESVEHATPHAVAQDISPE